MSQSRDFLGLIQAPNISKHISRNGGATIKASRKTAHDVFLSWGKKAIFAQKMVASSKKVIALNMYICTNVLVYERWLVLKVWYIAGPTLSPFHRLIMHVSQKCGLNKN